MAVPELPLFDARSFTKRLFERVRQGFGYVEIDGVRYPVKNEAQPYAVFDPDGAQSFNKFVTALRQQQDNVERLDAALLGNDGMKEHLDRLDSREAAHHAAQDGRLDALEAAHRPFASGSG
jgi:hypothetical protein